MSKDLEFQFQIIRQSIGTIDVSKARTDIRKNQMLVKMWNAAIGYMIDISKDPVNRAYYRALYGALSDKTAKELTWQQMKSFADSIMEGASR